jgi:acetyltransferase-like isoleucine patch superfamily enzyme
MTQNNSLQSSVSAGSLQENPPLNQWHRLSESLSVALLGWMPSKLGAILRHQVYAKLFRRMGNTSSIEKGVHFYRLKNIELGDNVSISHGCSFISSDNGGRIILNSRVRLHDGVRIQCSGEQSEVLLQNQVTLDRGVDINSCEDGKIKICQETYVAPYTCIAGPGSIHIGEYCMIASHCGIYANNHIFTDRFRPIMLQGVTTEGIVIEDDCWLGTGVKVLDGVRIGRGCVIGAGAVVTKNIPPYSIAVGIPAKVIGTRGQEKPSEILQNEYPNNLQQVSP